MLLDSIKIDNVNELHQTINTFFSHTATGRLELDLEQAAESQCAIAFELAKELLKTHSPRQAWCVILIVLRCLPWAVDPENASECSLYRYFGGLEHSSARNEELFNSMAEMVHNQKTWQDIVNYASNALKVNEVSTTN
jgi:hypothetical protein